MSADLVRLVLERELAREVERCAIVLHRVKRRCRVLEALTWRELLIVEGLCFALGVEGPIAEYRRLRAAAELLAAALAWYRPGWIVQGRWPLERALEAKWRA